MISHAQQTRQIIVQHADQLFYERGFDHTSFAQIAKKVGISRGNFYYHFRTKDQILDAVIESRITKTKRMLEAWEAESNHPAERVKCFIRILIQNGQAIMNFGCPVGTLTTELAKLNHPAQSRAHDIFKIFKDWLTKQLTALGKSKPEKYAMTLLARSQGIATLANAFKDEAFVLNEVEDLENWLENIP